MEVPVPSLTEEDLTEVKKDVSSSAGLGAAGRAGAEESGNPEPSERREASGRKSAGSGAQRDLPASGELAGNDPPATCVSVRVSLPAPAWTSLCHPLLAGGFPSC